jgi:hypothetical protein
MAKYSDESLRRQKGEQTTIATNNRCTNINFPAKGRACQVPSSQGTHQLQKGSLQENVVFLTQKATELFGWFMQKVCEINFVFSSITMYNM